jgi:hypothetical protein
VIHRQREKTAIAQSPAQRGRIGRNHRTHPIRVAQCNRRRDGDLRSVIKQQPRDSGKPLRGVVARLGGLGGWIERSAVAHILLADVSSPLQ